MKITKEILIAEVEKYNKIVQIIQEKEQERLKILGKIEFIESQLKDDEFLKTESTDEVIPTRGSGSVNKKKKT